MDQQQKVWFITGCSTGFGRELAEQVIDQGYRVAVTARNTESLQSLKDENKENVLLLNLDVTDKDQINEAVHTTIQTFGEINVLVNNAGIGYFSSVEESKEEEIHKMFNINFWGLMDVTNAVLPHMRKQQSGHIINLSLIGGIASFPALGYYHATKYAVEGISESLSQEVAPFNIHVTLLEPSSFRTDWAGRSSIKTKTAIYKETVEPTISTMAEYSGQEPGNPKKAAEAMISIVETENPPLRLLLGETAYQVATHKYQNLLQDIETWKDTSLGADFK